MSARATRFPQSDREWCHREGVSRPVDRPLRPARIEHAPQLVRPWSPLVDPDEGIGTLDLGVPHRMCPRGRTVRLENVLTSAPRMTLVL